MNGDETQGNLGLGPLPTRPIQMVPDWQIDVLPTGEAAAQQAARHMTIENLADHMGVSKSTMSKKLSGKCGWFIDELERYARITKSWALQQYICKPMFTQGRPTAVDCGNGMVMVDKREYQRVVGG